MRHAISSYATNTPWARWAPPTGDKEQNLIDMDGAGTSASTPQVAAACALYLGYYATDGDKPLQELRSWERTEIVRTALFKSADAKPGHVKEFGNGFLRANDMLSHQPAGMAVAMTEPDSVCFPFMEAHLGLDSCKGVDKMRALEAAQLFASRSVYEEKFEDWDATPATRPQSNDDRVVAMRRLLMIDGSMSSMLENFLMEAITSRRLTV